MNDIIPGDHVYNMIDGDHVYDIISEGLYKFLDKKGWNIKEKLQILKKK